MQNSKCKIFLFPFLFLFFLLPSSLLAKEAPVFRGEEVVVTALRYPQLRSEAPSVVSVITKEDIKAWGARNIAEALRCTFGADVKTTGYIGAASSARLRGSTSEQVLVLMDGRRVNSPLMGRANLGDLLTGGVERIEVVRGPTSALYGGSALGGVINIITKKGQRDRKTEIATRVSEYGTQQYRAETQGASGVFNYFFSGGYLKTTGFRDNSDYSSQNYSAALGWRLAEESDLRIDFTNYISDRGVPGSLTYPTSTTRQGDINSFIGLSLDTKLNPWSDLGVKAYRNQIFQTYNPDPSLYPDDLYKGWTTGVELQNNLRLGSQNLLAYGLEWRRDEGDSSKAGVHTIYHQALFIQDEIRMGDLSLILGVRGDRHSVSGDVVSPRIGGVYHWGRDTTFRTSWGQAFRPPTLNELYWYHYDPLWGIVTRGNQNLEPERSQMFEAGLERQMDLETRGSVTWYTGRVENLIKWVDVSGTWLTWEAQNIASANLTGIEFELVRTFGDNLKTFINYTNQIATDANTGQALVYSPQDKYNVGVCYQDGEGNGSSLNARYVGPRFDDEANTKKLPSYLVVDAKFWKEIGCWTLSLAVANLFNEDYQETMDYPMPGRKCTWGLGCKF